MSSFSILKKYNILNNTKSIVLKAINGDKQSFELLINEYKDYLYKLAFLHLKNEHDTIEVCQETIYKAIINIHKLRNPSYFKTWISKILLNNIHDFINERNKNIQYIELSNIVSQDITYDNLEEKLDLYDALDLLDKKFKTPIILQYFHSMSIREIAELLDCNENTVKTNISRGKKILYKVLMEEKNE